MKDILFFGIQGSGKGTQARKILTKYEGNFSYFEPGNILRAIKSNDNAIGNYIRNVIDSGKLINESVILSLFDAYHATLLKDQGMLIDGFPRSFPQMYMFLDRMYRFNRDWIAILIDISPEESMNRLLKRGREDDKPDLIKQRVQLYYDETMAVINEFDNLKRMVKIDGMGTEEEVFQRIEKIIEQHG
ncbi:MAG TPA: nucleoside monophosphate kinase [Candidatus Absconditabacterales bacterium]|nr:nucleoside monophosphate kinase [Candidatus Absconditabacterales bacterium]